MDVETLIRREAARRIALSGHDNYVMRKVSNGKPIPEELLEYAEAVREASKRMIENPPEDIYDNENWPEGFVEGKRSVVPGLYNPARDIADEALQMFAVQKKKNEENLRANNTSSERKGPRAT